VSEMVGELSRATFGQAEKKKERIKRGWGFPSRGRRGEVCSGRVKSCHASRAFGKTRKARERDGYEGLSPEICKTRGG
jgi:hypothetical protein